LREQDKTIDGLKQDLAKMRCEIGVLKMLNQKITQEMREDAMQQN
jgi:hypothetical protein